MRLIWNVKLYYVGTKAGYRVKIEGNPNPNDLKPWVFAEGNGPTSGVALNQAIESMAASDAAKFLEFLDNTGTA
jgi:hypothetical protein